MPAAVGTNAGSVAAQIYLPDIRILTHTVVLMPRDQLCDCLLPLLGVGVGARGRAGAIAERCTRACSRRW